MPTNASDPAGSIPDLLSMALEATRLLGRWSLVAQRHGNGCSCCPGLGEVRMDEVERHVLHGLRMRHPLLLDRESLLEFLRECVRRPGSHAAQAEQLHHLFGDVAKSIEHLEQIQRGF